MLRTRRSPRGISCTLRDSTRWLTSEVRVPRTEAAATTVTLSATAPMRSCTSRLMDWPVARVMPSRLWPLKPSFSTVKT